MKTQTITLKVEGMHCESCPKLIKMDLEDKSGVMSVKTDLETKLVVIEFDSNKISVDQLINSVKDSGYAAERQL